MKTAVVASCALVCLLLLALFVFQDDENSMMKTRRRRRQGNVQRNVFVRKHPTAGKQQQQQHRIAILIPYIGNEIPPYLSLFCTAARGSASLVDFLIIHDGSLRDYHHDDDNTDDDDETADDNNVRFIDLGSTQAMATYMARVVHHHPQFATASLRESSKAYTTLVKQITAYLLHNPYLLIEFKPAYGYIFQDFIINNDYTHWGYADLDMVFGDLPRWITTDELTNFDIVTYGFGDQNHVYLRGQFTFHRMGNKNDDDNEKENKMMTLWRACTYLSELDERFHKVVTGQEDSLVRESAEGCYSAAVLDRQDLRIKYAVKAFTDVQQNQQDSIHTHGLYFGIGRQHDRSVIYKAHSSLDANGLLSISPTWFEEEEGSYQEDSLFLYSDPSNPPLQREVGERVIIPLGGDDEDTKNNNNKNNCMYWIRKKYQSKLCLSSSSSTHVTKSHTLFYLDGKLYKQQYKNEPLPHGILSAPFFHFQEWKRCYRSGQLYFATTRSRRQGSSSALTWILTKEGILPIHIEYDVTRRNKNNIMTKNTDGVSPLGGGIHYPSSHWKTNKGNDGGIRKLLPTTTRYCLVSQQRTFPPLPKDASTCVYSVSWQDNSNVVEILQTGIGWKNTIRPLEDVTLVLTLQLSQVQTRSHESTKALLDLAIANIHSWSASGRQPCVLLIYMSSATTDSITTIKEELSYLGSDMCFIALIKGGFGNEDYTLEEEQNKNKEQQQDQHVHQQEEEEQAEVYLDYVSRKALLNMATDIAPTRWILSGIEVERGMVLSTDAALFCYRHAKAHGEVTMGTVLIVPQFSIKDNDDKKNDDHSFFVSITKLMEMREKGIIVDPSTVVELDHDDGCQQPEASVGAVFKPVHKLWWQQTMAELEHARTPGKEQEAEEQDSSSESSSSLLLQDELAKTISSLETSFTSLMQREHHAALEKYDNFPILLVDNLSPKAGLLTSTLVREVEELGGKRCYNLLRLAQLATLGYHVQVVSGAFAISTTQSRRQAFLTMSENDVSRCDGCVMYPDNPDVERNILRDERYRPAKTAVVWYELESAELGGGRSSDILRRKI